MARMYTFDEKLLCGSPEIRIGDKVYPVDDRTSTVKKALKLFGDTERDNFDITEDVLKLAFGKNYKEIESLDMPFAAYQELTQTVISAMTGAEPDELKKKAESF